MQKRLISIHSARVGGDVPVPFHTSNTERFQSTPPVWAETGKTCYKALDDPFQSTPPVWAETRTVVLCALNLEIISIHSARVGGDKKP